MGNRDYYDVLGVSRNAGEAEIKSAYRRMARKYHPDVNKASDASDRFKEATEAYEVLIDPQKRKMYDQFGHARAGAAAGPGARTYTWTSTGAAPDFNFEDIFGGFTSGFVGMGLDEILERLGGGPSRRSARRGPAPKGADLEYNLTLDFMAALRGTTAAIRLQSPDGESETINVKIPPGVHDGSKVRVRGKGNQGPGGRGDLYIITAVRPHPYFRREGGDIYVDVPVSITEAALGAKVDVPTTDGMMTIKVPPGSAGSRKLRLRGKGAPSADGKTRGDQYVVLRIVPPEKISPRGADLLKQFDESEKFDPRANVPWK
ncbi:MAG TPA: DnaJ C-terminal domain-containing protein [Phycisphaerae bacterium]|nr:DnaJ C-terminal domain-containing protein [Phycisphaerae bacterium]